MRQYSVAKRSGFLTTILAVLMLVSLTGCLTVSLVEDYDAVIDGGLHQYDESINGFLNRMERLGGQEAGHYSKNPDIPKFYAEQLGKLQALEDRAEALGGKECLPAIWGSEGIEWLLAQTVDLAAEFDDEDLSRDIRDGLNDLQNKEADAYRGKSCTQIVLYVVAVNHRLLEAIHKDEDKLLPEVVAPARGLVRQGVRMAMQNESAKKRE